MWKTSYISHDNTAVTTSNEGLKTTIAVRFKTPLVNRGKILSSYMGRVKKKSAILTYLLYSFKGERGFEKKIYI